MIAHSLTIGVLGGGQLGRMLALAGYPLGMRFKFLDPAYGAPAGQVAPLVTGRFDDEDALWYFADRVDLATYEFENVPVAAARWLAERMPLFPPVAALEASQDRLAERRLLQRLGIPTPAFEAVDSPDALRAAAATIGWPAILKTRRLGYDGKGQHMLRGGDDLEPAWAALHGAPCILDALVPFERELSIIAVRGRGGETAFYPLVQNRHKGGILRQSLAPAPGVSPALQRSAEDFARRVLDDLGYVGVLAIEFFERAGQLLANELAPRVHNSGHWTIEGARTSQFENHIRAIAGLPLGSAAATGPTAMLNLIGTTPPPADILAVPNVHLHLYSKSPRPGRKLGHVTVMADDQAALDKRLGEISALLSRQD